MLLLAAVWLIVLGYTSLYVGVQTLEGKTLGFGDALSGKTSG